MSQRAETPCHRRPARAYGLACSPRGTTGSTNRLNRGSWGRDVPTARAGHHGSRAHEHSRRQLHLRACCPPRSHHSHGDSERSPAGVQRDGPRVRARRVQPGDLRGARPLRRHLPPRHRRADRAGRARPPGLRRHHAVRHPGGDRARPRPRAGRPLHRQRPLPRRNAPDGRALREALLLPGRAVRMARQHRPLARHRRNGARGLLRQRDGSGAGGAASPAGEALQARRDGRGDPLHHPVQHPHRGPAHRGHQGPGRGAHGRRASA